MEREPTVFVVDDDLAVRKGLQLLIESADMKARTFASAREFLESYDPAAPGCIVLDIRMPGMSGLELQESLGKRHVTAPIIVISGHADVPTAVHAVKLGAFDFLEKPLNDKELIESIGRALAEDVRNRRGAPQRQETASRLLIGQSPPIERVRRLIAEVAPTDMTVLVRGESGTGKEIVARLIHDLSGRSGQTNFVKVNCPAIPESLLESELFGHERGAFTGADRQKPGRFESAEGGTLFLDEIAEVTPALQAKLLQAVEEKRFLRVGGRREIHVDVRIVAASNASLEQMIAEGRFRSDLFYRLQRFSIVVPPLRDRREDIPVLVDHFLAVYASKYRRPQQTILPETLAHLREAHWPGNVRELESLIERFALTGDPTVLDHAGEGAPRRAFRVGAPGALDPGSLRHVFSEEAEIDAITRALAETRWNQRQAAQLLGIGYGALRRRIEKYGLKDLKLDASPRGPDA
ncbi:MAG TPA: sigma-54 dependent transcriptional regulator [Sumerlaeia bacterium]|nr:sigma-54 dependent transcriptional regulator [Sumerlaeia bacterium]